MSNQNIVGAGYALEDNALYDAITEKSISPYVVARQKEFSKFDSIIYELNGNASTRTAKRRFDMGYIGDLTITATIKTGGRTSLSATMLELSMTDEAFDDFIVDRMLYSSVGTVGLVRSHVPGKVTIEFLSAESGATSFVSADFAAGTQVTQGSDVSKGVTGGKESQLYVPQTDFNVIGQQVYTYEITREDISAKTVVYYGGKRFWQYANYDIFMKEMSNMKTWRNWNAQMVNIKNKWVPGGYKWQIKNMGGMQGTYNGTLDETKLMEIAEEINSRGNGTKEMWVRMGSAAWAGLQLGTGSKYITTAGISNTIGGATVKGINIKKWTCLGIDFIFERWAPLDNANLNPEGRSAITGKLKSSHTAVFYDTSPVGTFGFGEKPFISPYHFGDEAMGSSIVKGRIDFMGNYVAEASNDVNACRVIFEENSLWQLNDPTRHYLLTIAA